MIRYALLLLGLVCATPAIAQDAPDPDDRQVYFGEQHMHTQNSFDGFTVAPHQTWEDAFRYGMGEPITLTYNGVTIQRRTPYDFVAITDHSEYYGVLKQLTDPDNPLSQSEFAKGFTRGILGGDNEAAAKYVSGLIGTLLTNNPMEEYVTPDLLTGNWAKFIEVADRFYKPGEFTTLYGYEWTSIPNGQNMHRNVFFREKPPIVPFSSFDSQNPEDLWTYLEIQRNSGIPAFAIPHNSNVSDGWMFSPNKFHGGPIDARYAKRRLANEPAFEIAQTKGQSDAHPVLWREVRLLPPSPGRRNEVRETARVQPVQVRSRGWSGLPLRIRGQRGVGLRRRARRGGPHAGKEARRVAEPERRAQPCR
jgi:hypothetical protein